MQDAAVAVVIDFDRRFDAADGREFDFADRPTRREGGLGSAHDDLLPRLEIGWNLHIKDFGAINAERSGRFTALVRQRQHAHADEVGAVDALEAFGDHGLHAQQKRPLAAQSRLEPMP